MPGNGAVLVPANDLDGFDDDPARSNEAKLEGIWTYWHGEWEDNQQ